MILRTSVTILIFCEALMLGMLGNNYVIPLVAMLAAFYFYLRPIEVSVSLATRIIVPVILIGYFFFRYVSIPDLVSRSEWVFPTRITVSLAECFLLGQLFELIKKRDLEDGLLNFCLLAMAVVVCCCCRAASGSQRSLLFVGSVVSVTLICTIFQYSTRTFQASANSRRKGLAYRSTLVSATMVIVGISSWYLSGTLQDNIEGFQNWWIRNLQISGLRTADATIAYTNEATLRNITALKKSNPQDPALNIYSEVPPGYLRGRAFDSFDGRQWMRRFSSDSIQRIQPPTQIANRNEDFFQLADTSLDRYQMVRVENVPKMSFYFLPLNASYVSGQPSNPNRRIEADRAKIVIGGISVNTSYSAYVDVSPPTMNLAPVDLRRLTSIPPTIESQVVELAKGISNDDRSDAQRIASIEKYFQDNYTYSLKQERIRLGRRDRLSHFILEKPPAHCEFFASAAVVCLRANGIPARYVTGFATDEHSDEEEYYIARNKDAHAWAEAFDRDRKQWVVVEATPGMTMPKSIWDQITDDELETSGEGGDAANSELRKTWTSVFIDIWTQVREFFEEIGRQLRGPINIAIVSLALFTFFYQYWWKRRNLPYSRSREGLLERERIKVEKMLARLKFSRQPNETMFQFEQRIRSQSDSNIEEKISRLLDWFRDYEKSRFSSDIALDTVPIAPKLK